MVAPAISMAQYGNGYGQPGYNQGPGGPGGPGGWDAPPNDFRQQMQRDAFHAGIEGARRDAENHRQPNVMNRDEFRNYRGPNRRLYRDAFQRGYQTFWSHQGGPGRFNGPRPY